MPGPDPATLNYVDGLPFSRREIWAREGDLSFPGVGSGLQAAMIHT